MTQMAACYRNYNFILSEEFTVAATSSISKQHCHVHQKLKRTQENQQKQSSPIPLGQTTGVAPFGAVPLPSLRASAKNYDNNQKDYFIPLHVDCSVEYELPKQPKPPRGQRIEPLLMIHPCYFRKMESQRRSPFINNMPNATKSGAAMFVGVALISQNSSITAASASTFSSKRFKNHNHIRQNSSAPYCSNAYVDQRHQLHQFCNPQDKVQQNLRHTQQHSSGPIQKTSTERNKNQSIKHDRLVQNFPLLRSERCQWEQLAGMAAFVKFSTNDKNSYNQYSASNNNSYDTPVSSMAANSKSSKHDRVISRSIGYSANFFPTTNNILRSQMNKNCNNTWYTALIPNEKLSTRHFDTTKQSGNYKTNTLSRLYMVNHIPITSVPRNCQAGPDNTPTKTIFQNKYKTMFVNNDENVIKCNVSGGKALQHVSSSRVHPYLTEKTSYSDQRDSALSSKLSALLTPGDMQILPQFRAVKTAAIALSTESPFQ